MKDTIFSESEKLSTVLLIIFGLLPLSRAIYWFANSSNAVCESPFYEKLNSIAPLFVWGIPFLIGSILIIVASVFIISTTTKKYFNIFVSIGGFICGIGFAVIAAASVENNINWLTPVHNTCYTVGFLALTWIGISPLWNNHRHKI